MKKISNILLVIPIIFLFRTWFLNGHIIGGDWPYFYSETLSEFSFLTPSWLTYHGNGLGGQAISYALDSYLYFIVALFVNTFHIPWEIVYIIFFFGLYIVASIFSSRFLLRVLFPSTNTFQAAISSFLYTVNTHTIMMVGGGQMGIALAYSLAPFVVGSFILLIRNQNAYYLLVSSVCLAIQLMFDARISFVTLMMLGLYIPINLIVNFAVVKKTILRSFLFLGGAFGITFLLQAYWIFPLLIYRQNPADLVYYGYVSPKLFEFLSFATFSQAFSLLHPNWPENIFGKVYFMKPEFLIFPVLAFSPLIFLIKTQNKKLILSVLYCSVMVIVGAFLSKGTQAPFGEVNIWLYNTIPGFSFFRDPTKFYMVTSLAFSMLIPMAFYLFAQKIREIKWVFALYGLFFTFLLYTIHPLWLGQLGGTFGNRKVSNEYVELKDFLYSQPEFFRVFWVPHQHKFGFYSNNHPPIDAMAFFNASDSATAIKKMSESGELDKLSGFSTKYIIIPYDDAGELFVADRKYSERLYAQTVEQVLRIQDLKLVKSFGKIKVFELSSFSPHFYLENGQNLSVYSDSPVEYRISFQTDSQTNLIFTDKFSPYWKMSLDGKEIPHENKNGQNVYGSMLPGNYQGVIYFSQAQTYLNSTILSVVVFIITILTVAKLRLFTKQRD